MANAKFLYRWTEDGLRLSGVHRKAGEKDTCVVFVHGLAATFPDNYFANVLGEELSKNNIGFIYGHNRGYGYINEILSRKKERKLVQIGAMFEKFEDSLTDIRLWVREARSLGYKKIILMGHSYGCNKAIYYYYEEKPKDVVAIILASPPDMVGLSKIKKYNPIYEKMLAEAKNNVSENEPRKLLSALMWKFYPFSSQTFLDIFVDDSLADNLPILRNPKEFSQLGSIDVPILAFLGERDDIVIRSLEDDLKTIERKAKKCPKFTRKILKGANHDYDRKEKEMSEMIMDWIKSLGI